MKKILLLLLGFIVFTLISCKKVQPNMDTVDCSCAKEVSADFTMEERGTVFGPNPDRFLTLTDTTSRNKVVKFSAKEVDAEYTWYIGTEIINSKTFERNFPDIWAGQNIPITLVVKKKTNRICFPNDDGYDSITKILHVSQYPIETADNFIMGSLEGVYRFKSAHLADSFDVTFYFSKNTSIDLFELFNLENYDGMGANCYDNRGIEAGNYRQCFIINNGYCSLLEGNIHNKMDGTATMDFSIYYPGHPNYQVFNYKGRRISNL
jgi:hypothetical protein